MREIPARLTQSKHLKSIPLQLTDLELLIPAGGMVMEIE